VPEIAIQLARSTARRRATRAALLGGAWLSALAMLAPDAAHAQQGPFVYVPNLDSNNVTVIDTPTNAVAPTAITVGLHPVAAAVRGDESLVYVTNSDANTVSVINTATNTVVATIPVGNLPQLVAVSPDGTRVYVPNELSDTVSVINTATNTVVATIPVGSQPVGAGVSPDGARVYVTNHNFFNVPNANTVSVINTATNTVVATIPVGGLPSGVAVTPDGTHVYVTNAGSDNVSVINTATNTVIATIPLDFFATPQIVAVSPNGSRAYVADFFTNSVSLINTATNTVVATTIPVGGFPIGVIVTPDGTRAYVTNNLDNTVSVIDTATNTVVATIPVGLSPWVLGICSNGNALLAAGLTFKANTSGALTCTLASGPTGSPGPVFTGGTLQFAGANMASSLPILLQAAGGTFDTNGNNATLAGAISGPGGLTKIGTGTLTLTGASTYAGPTNINAGALNVNGSLASTVFANSGGTLMGNGTIGGLNVLDGGTVAPGNSIGTLNVAGNVSFGPGSIYQVEVNAAGQADKIVAGGTATLSGGTVQVLAQNGGYARQTRYTILTVSSGVSGTFAGVTSNLAFLTPTLSYDPNAVGAS
jgi:YVTN family beta-propeller protein/autotransporter-associated beta strand protein